MSTAGRGGRGAASTRTAPAPSCGRGGAAGQSATAARASVRVNVSLSPARTASVANRTICPICSRPSSSRPRASGMRRTTNLSEPSSPSVSRASVPTRRSIQTRSPLPPGGAGRNAASGSKRSRHVHAIAVVRSASCSAITSRSSGAQGAPVTMLISARPDRSGAAAAAGVDTTTAASRTRPQQPAPRRADRHRESSSRRWRPAAS